MTESESATEDPDFSGNGSLAEIMSKMGDIDRVLSEINEIGSGKVGVGSKSTNTDGINVALSDSAPKTDRNSTVDPNVSRTKSSTAVAEPSYDESCASVFSDGDVYGDGGGNNVAGLQGELMAADEADRQAKEERLKAAEMRKQCIESRTKVYGTWEESLDGQEGKKVKKSITITLTKPTKESALGISMKTSKGVTRIVSISDEGLLAGSGLKPMYELKEVNGEELKNARHARSLIQAATDEVKIVAVYDEEDA